MKQYEAVIRVMEEAGGFATLGHLYQNALKVEGPVWKTKTPYASIRRIVQDERFFFKIRPGLWALKKYKKTLPKNIFPSSPASEAKKDEYNHTYYQGLLLEIGNMKQMHTFVPHQDKNKKFLDRKLCEISTIKEFYRFGYDHIIRKAQTIDVSWFNARKMPERLFEVEHSTDFQNSLLKFMELRDFNTEFYLIADDARKNECDARLSSSVFSPIRERVRFISYENLSAWHSKTFELASIEKELSS